MNISLLRFKLIYIILLLLCFVSLNFSYSVKAYSYNQRTIILFNSDIIDSNYKDYIIKKHNGTKIKEISILNGVIANFSAKDKKELEVESCIRSVEEDKVVRAAGRTRQHNTIIQPEQIKPWGITKIKADSLWNISNGNSIKVAILDSGVDFSHPDLKEMIKGGYNALNSKKIPSDDYGHGTHVAGIIAASNNSIGVVGVSPNADLYVVKVLDGAGNGYSSDLIEGIGWAITNKMNIVNMSLEAQPSEALYNAIKKANESGIVQVSSSGNNPDNPVTYPAAYSEVISVTAIDSNDERAFYASTGKVDIAAPGVDIYSTYIGSIYSIMSGTSMAAPHVTGVVALMLSNPLSVDLNLDGKVTPSEVKQKLEKTAFDLGIPGKDNIYGSGLVNSYAAVTN
ncbi:MAG: S8 family peptidase [Clostridiaceae bacterium]